MWANFTALLRIAFLPLTFVWDKVIHYVAPRAVDIGRETKTVEGLVDDLITKSGKVQRKNIDDSLGRKKDNLSEYMDEKFARHKDDLMKIIDEKLSILPQISAALSKLVNETIALQNALLELVQKFGPIRNRLEHMEGAGKFTQSLIMNKTKNSLMIRGP